MLRRRTLPWERSTDLDATTAPTPWLALVLIAEGEGQLLTDVAVAQCVTPGVTLAGEADVPKSACLEVAEEVVEKTFPTLDDLRLLSHVRAVDLADTELAMGDDDGFLAVVLGNRLPQPGVRYLACLINVEGQHAELPVIQESQLQVTYVREAAVIDLRAEAAAAYGDHVAYDTAAMQLPGAQLGSQPLGPRALAGPSQSVAVHDAAGAAAFVDPGWAAGPSGRVPNAAYAESANKARLELADGFSLDLGVVLRRQLRFPVLAYWSFQCEERGDFQYLAEHVHTRLLGHVPAGPETPDGDPVDPDDPPVPGNVPEPAPSRPLPLVAETGHVELEHASRAGEPAPAWFRGPLTPLPVPRAALRPDGRPPLAHHADQLRRVVPDGQEDLGYAAAFELGRLLALAQSSVVAVARPLAPGRLRRRARAGDRRQGGRRMRRRACASWPGAPIRSPRTSSTGCARARSGRAALRAVAELLARDGAAGLGPQRPLADPSAAAEDLDEVAGDREALAGLGVGDVRGEDPAKLLEQLASQPVAGARSKPELVRAALRGALEEQAMQVATGARRKPRGPGPGPSAAAGPELAAEAGVVDRAGTAAGAGTAGGAGAAASEERDALDELLDRAEREAAR